MTPQDPVVARYHRIGHVLVGLLPKRFRAKFGAAIEETLVAGLYDHRGRQRFWFALVNYQNIVTTAARERLAPTTTPSMRLHARPSRAQRGATTVQSILQDLRFAIRSLRRQPGFALIVIATLALGIGANTTIFSVINAVLLDPLPYSNPGELVVVGAVDADTPRGYGRMSRPDTEDISDLPAFTSLVGYSTTAVTLIDGGEPAVFQAARVAQGMLSTFERAPMLGKDVTQADATPDAPRVTVISHRFWQDVLGGREDVIGSSVMLSEVTWHVIGVAPAGFNFPDGVDIWQPWRMRPEDCTRGCQTLLTIGRLAPGATLTQAQTQMTALGERLASELPDTNFDKRFAGDFLRNRIVGDVRSGLWIVLGAVGLVLLIACANVAILLLVRATARQGEIAIRTALGASRGRLLRQVLVESQVLAFVGAGLGTLGAWVAVNVLKQLSAGTIPRIENVSLDGSVLTVTLAATVIVALLFGLAPAITLSRAGATGGLNASGRGGLTNPGDSRFRSVLMGTEVAMSLLLLTGSGLLLKTFARLYAVDLGYETEEIIRFTVSIPSARYETLEQVATFYETLDRQIATTPGVAAVGAVYGAPLGRGNITGQVLVEGRPEPPNGSETFGSIRPVTSGYFDAMRLPLLRGRGVESTDVGGSIPVAVVNEVFVRENFPNEDPLGQRVYLTAGFGYTNPTWTIVGVTRDIRSRSLTREPVPEIYVPHSQFGPAFMTVNVRGMPGGPPLINTLRAELKTLDPSVPMRNVETVRDAVTRQLAPTRFYLILVGSFAALAVILSAIGLYGVVSYLVSRRAREIGIRLALGAKTGTIVRLVATQGLRPAIVGLIAGVIVSLASTRLLSSILYEVRPNDMTVLGGVTSLVLLVSLVAVFLPAGRASRVNPVSVMREQ